MLPEGVLPPALEHVAVPVPLPGVQLVFPPIPASVVVGSRSLLGDNLKEEKPENQGRSLSHSHL